MTAACGISSAAAAQLVCPVRTLTEEVARVNARIAVKPLPWWRFWTRRPEGRGTRSAADEMRTDAA